MYERLEPDLYTAPLIYVAPARRICTTLASAMVCTTFKGKLARGVAASYMWSRELRSMPYVEPVDLTLPAAAPKCAVTLEDLSNKRSACLIMPPADLTVWHQKFMKETSLLNGINALDGFRFPTLRQPNINETAIMNDWENFGTCFRCTVVMCETKTEKNQDRICVCLTPPPMPTTVDALLDAYPDDSLKREHIKKSFAAMAMVCIFMRLFWASVFLCLCVLVNARLGRPRSEISSARLYRLPTTLALQCSGCSSRTPTGSPSLVRLVQSLSKVSIKSGV
jgi:hypothetical protein